eukprot:CAMPEP_0116834752 /NCGR_PEP_ID=MMETSP0418-20121206/7161_1 /TAXON_ID=1158023 /ORGANISM="Astrosyne radiata, Strain 13vi08-1A" /LENGTH=505 /DNA_ID=CAMNT_0004464337 /DNA_START=38 /DNA_END=1555 /DNA_ORIENTATION=+
MAKDHERGTPRGPFLSATSRRIALILSVLTSSAFSTWLLSSRLEGFVLLPLVTALGACSCLVGIVWGASMHAYALFASWTIVTAMQGLWEAGRLQFETRSLLLLQVGIVSDLMPSVFSFLASSLVDPLMIGGTAGVLVLVWVWAVVDGLAQERVLEGWALGCVASLHLMLLGLWFMNRSHKYQGSLTLPGDVGTAVATGMALLWGTSLQGPPITVAWLLGSCTCSLLWCSFGAVADVWYTVGTGQFWMVTLDTASVWIYIGSPGLVLMALFQQKYGSAAHSTLVSMSKLVVGDDNLLEPETHEIAVCVLLALCTVVGIPLLNAYCPVGAYLFGRVYTHGQQGTKKVALLVPFKQEIKKVLSQWSKQKVWVNILIKAADLQDEDLQKSIKAGHGTVVVGSDIESAVLALHPVQPSPPEWYIGIKVRQATKQNLKVCYWSSILSEASIKEVEEQNGGSIIFARTSTPTEMEKFTEEACSKGYSFCPLSEVARDAPPMTLEESHETSK